MACPKCGYCKECGRGGPVYPTLYPIYTPLPQPLPWWQQPNWTGQGTTGGTGASWTVSYQTGTKY